MSATPMTIHIYNANDEVVKTLTRSFVPWKLLKKAVEVSAALDPKDMTPETIDQLSSLVIAVFGDQVSREELDEGADVSEMVAVLRQIVAKASGSNPNPTPPG
jgi:hypothetical protein